MDAAEIQQFAKELSGIEQPKADEQLQLKMCEKQYFELTNQKLTNQNQ
jgi:hypothetical protein